MAKKEVSKIKCKVKNDLIINFFPFVPAPIDIQSILNGAAKFCRHCDVVILNNMIRKKVSDLPCLSKETDLLDEDEDLFFCSSTCFMQFALMHKSPSITEDKVSYTKYLFFINWCNNHLIIRHINCQVFHLIPCPSPPVIVFLLLFVPESLVYSCSCFLTILFKHITSQGK